MTTVAPASPSACAIARPIPRVPPVTSATLPSSLNLSKIMLLPLLLLARLAHRSDVCVLREDHEVADRDVARAGEHEQDRLGHLVRLHQAACRERLIELLLRPVAEQG